MRTKLPLFLLVTLLICSCASRPLVYEEMTDDEKTSEATLQLRLETTAVKIGSIAFDFVPEEDQKGLASSVITALKVIQDILEAGDLEKLTKELISRTIGDFEVLGANIQDIANDAFDLFNGWVNLPNVNDYLPEVVRDRLLAFIRGGIAGLEPYAA